MSLTKDDIENYVRAGSPPMDFYEQLTCTEIADFQEAVEALWLERIAVLASCLATTPEQAEATARGFQAIDGGATLRDIVEKRITAGKSP